MFELGSRLRPRWLIDNPLAGRQLRARRPAAPRWPSARALVALGAPPLSAVLAALVAASTSPIIVMAVVHELRPRGQVGERLLMMCALNSVLAMLALKLWPLLSLAGAGHAGQRRARPGWPARCSWSAAPSCSAWPCGWMLDRAARLSQQRASAPVLQIALVMLAATLAVATGGCRRC